jgi:hypothetical protein
MELLKLKESVRRNMCKNNISTLDIVATGHNLIRCIEDKSWERLPKKLHEFTISYNCLIEDLNKMETPVEEEIIRLEEELEKLRSL